MTEQAVLLPAVDLRANIDTVYNQSGYAACAAHAVTNALDCMADRAGQSKRFSRAWVWWWQRAAAGKTGENDGAGYDGVKTAIEQHGAVYEADFPWDGISQYNIPPPMLSRIGKVSFLRMQQSSVENVKRKLCLGQPVILELIASTQFYWLQEQHNWREHAWRADGQGGAYQHATCIVGYDDAAGRFLVENSWGPQWGDGGFFGVRYEDFNSIKNAAWCIERVVGLQFKTVEAFVSIPYLLDPQDNAAFTTGNKSRVTQIIAEAFERDGMQAAIDVCKVWSVSDKHLEHIFKWNRGAVRAFQEADKSINWDGFIWAAL